MKEIHIDITPTVRALQKLVTSPHRDEILQKLYAELDMILPGMSLCIDEWVGQRTRLQEAISSLADELGVEPASIHEDFDKYISSARQWGQYGWTLFPNAPIRTFLTPPTDRVDANKTMRALASATSIEYLWQLVISIAHKRDMQEAKTCFLSKEYKACALILCSRIDASLIRRQPRTAQRRHSKVVERFEKAYSSDLDIHKVHYRALRYAGLVAALTQLYQNSENFSTQPKIINRHFLVHGMLTRPVRRMDCIQLLLIYYNLTMHA